MRPPAVRVEPSARVVRGRVKVVLPASGELTAAQARRLAGELFRLANDLAGGEPYLRESPEEHVRVLRRF